MSNKFLFGQGLLWSSVLYAIPAVLTGGATWFGFFFVQLPLLLAGIGLVGWDLWQQYKKPKKLEAETAALDDLWQQYKKLKKLEAETAALEAEFRKKWGTVDDF